MTPLETRIRDLVNRRVDAALAPYLEALTQFAKLSRKTRSSPAKRVTPRRKSPPPVARPAKSPKPQRLRPPREERTPPKVVAPVPPRVRRRTDILQQQAAALPPPESPSGAFEKMLAEARERSSSQP